MTPELFNTYTDRFLGAIGAFVIILIATAFLISFFYGRKKKRKQKRLFEEEDQQFLVDTAERKTQFINKQICALDKCSNDIEKLTEALNKKTDLFIDTLQIKLSQYRETANLLKKIDENIQKSATTIQKNTLMGEIEKLTSVLEQKGKLFINTVANHTSESKATAYLIKKADKNIQVSAASISQSAALLDERDKELQEEISCLLSLEGKTNEEVNYLIHSYKKINSGYDLIMRLKMLFIWIIL